MFKKGITGKDSEMMTGKHLGPEPKKKKKIEANQVCSSEETPLYSCRNLRQELPGVPQPNMEYCVGTRGRDQGPSEHPEEATTACQVTQLCHTLRKQNSKNQPVLSF